MPPGIHPQFFLPDPEPRNRVPADFQPDLALAEVVVYLNHLVTSDFRNALPEGDNHPIWDLPVVGVAAADDPYFDLHQRAFFAPRSGDLIARVKQYVYLGGYVGGTGHGTPYDYDRHVPIVFLGPGIAPGRRNVPCGPEDIAWTLGRLLGLDYPQQDAATDLLPLLTPAP